MSKKTNKIVSEVKKQIPNAELSSVHKIGDVEVYSISVEKSSSKLDTQASHLQVFQNYFTKNSLIKHPVDRVRLTLLAITEPNHSACIELKSSIIARSNWKLLNDKDGIVKKFLDKPSVNLFDSFSDILYAHQRDFWTYDDAALEIVKVGEKPEDMSLYHINSKNLYVEPKVKSNRIIPGMVAKYHHLTSVLKFNSKSVFLPIERDTVLKNNNHYIAPYKGYSQNSDFYGEPCYVSAIPSIEENIIIKSYISSFFDNNATPNVAIVITGAEFSAANQTSLQDHVNKMKTSEGGSHSLLILSVPEQGAKVEIKELQKSVDAHFLQEREMIRTEILQTHQVPPKMLGISSLGSLGSGSEMIGAMKEFLEVFARPQQTRFGRYINLILEKMFGFNPEFEFIPYNINNDKDLAVIHNLLSKIVDVDGNSVMNVKEIREFYKMPAVQEGAKMPIGSKVADVNSEGDARGGENTESSGHPYDDTEIGTDNDGR